MPTTTETAASIHERFEATALPLHDSIYRANLRMTGDPVMAQDLTQETYLRAFRAFDSFQAGTNCRAWMLQISHNLFCRDYRGRKRITYRTAADDDVDVLAQFRADVPNPEEEALRQLDREAMRRAISKLPEPYRVAVTLVELQGLSCEEAAAVMGTPKAPCFRGCSAPGSGCGGCCCRSSAGRAPSSPCPPRILERYWESDDTAKSSQLARKFSDQGRTAMPRRRLLLTVSTVVAVALAVAGCTIPTTKDGGGYGPSNQTARKAAPPPPVELRSGAKQQLKSADSSWTPALYETATGAKIVLNVSNTDPTQHNFTLGELEISKNIPPTRAP